LASWSRWRCASALMQRSLKPRFSDPQLLIFAADHGVAVEGLAAPEAHEDACAQSNAC
jgi:NaMN:DMB phosphoribosyltransferase